MSNKIDRRGVAIGRFQPFHNGHLVLIRQILEDCDEVLVVVGSAQLNYTLANPFTAGERILMIRRALGEEGLDVSKIIIVPLVDEQSNARWFSMLASMLPPFDILYSGNHLIVALASSHLEIRSPRFVRRKEYNGSYIRNRILKGQKWSDFVSKSVFDIINNIDGIKRMKTLAKHELERGS
jgi:nicotinamide-nucleotide adenylyltransferase